jgi:hypothetical protein
MKLHFQFKPAVAADGRQRVIAELTARGAVEVHPLLPEEQDEELARLYVASSDDERAGQMIEFLRRSDAIEFAEREARRKLVR